jgi:hypothetical protein
MKQECALYKTSTCCRQSCLPHFSFALSLSYSLSHCEISFVFLTMWSACSSPTDRRCLALPLRPLPRISFCVAATRRVDVTAHNVFAGARRTLYIRSRCFTATDITTSIVITLESSALGGTNIRLISLAPRLFNILSIHSRTAVECCTSIARQRSSNSPYQLTVPSNRVHHDDSDKLFFCG